MAAFDQDTKEILKNTSVEEIQQMYKDRQITAQDKHAFLAEKGRIELDGWLEQGYGTAYWNKLVKDFSQGWENIKEAATHDTTPTTEGEAAVGIAKDVRRELYYSLLASWGMIQMAMSPMSAFGEVNGKLAENKALAAGLSPGAAWMLGMVVDIGSGFAVPINLAARSVVKGVQQLPKAAARMSRIAGETGRAATEVKAGADVIGKFDDEAKIISIMGKALERDGVKDVGKTLKEAAEAAGRPEIAQAINPELARRISRASEIAQQPIMERVGERAAQIASEVTEQVARKELPALMRQFGISFKDLKTIKAQRGTEAAPFTAQEFYGYLTALKPHVNTLANLARKATGPNGTDVDKLAFARYATQLFTGATDKLTYNKEFSNLLRHWNPEAVAKGDLYGAMTTFAQDIVTMVDKRGSTTLAKNILKNQEGFFTLGTDWWAKSKAAFTNLLMPLAWQPTIIGNSITLGTMVAERFVTAPHNALYMMKGTTMALGDAARTVGMAWATRGSRGPLPWFLQFPVDSTVAADGFYKVLMQRAILYDKGLSAAHAAGLRGSAAGAFVRNYAQNPPVHAVAEANELAYKATFNSDLGPLLSRWVPLGQEGPGSLYFLFVKSNVNLAKWAWHRTPGLQFVSQQLYRDMLKGGDSAERVIGQLTLSNLFAAFAYELAKEGYITGSGPLDPRIRSAWLATHEPNSIRTPGGWTPLSRGYEPVSQQMGLIADFVEIADQFDEMTLEQATAAVVLAINRDILERTTWNSVSDMIDAFQGITKGEELPRAVGRAVAAPIMAIVTGGPVGGRIKQSMDPAMRDARTLMDEWRSRTPGYSKSVPPRRDGYGDVVIPAQPAGTPWFGFLGPLAPKFKPQETDRVKVEGARLQARLPYFPDSIGIGQLPDNEIFDLTPNMTGIQPGDPMPVMLTPQQRDRWQQIYKNVMQGDGSKNNPGIEAGLLDTPEYQNAPLALQRSRFSNFATQAKEMAKQALIVEDPELARKIMQNKVDNIMPMLTETQQQAVSANLERAMSQYEGMAPDAREQLFKFGILASDTPVVRDGEKLYEPLTIYKTPGGVTTDLPERTK